MKTPNDGGAAFPVTAQKDRANWKQLPHQGMALRDWFAGQAVSGLLCSLDRDDLATFGRMTNDQRANLFAQHAYLVADAMIAARTQPTNTEAK